MSNKFNKLSKKVINNVKFEQFNYKKIVIEKPEDVLPPEMLKKLEKVTVVPNCCTNNAYQVSYYLPEVDFVECVFGEAKEFSLNPHCINYYQGHFFDVSITQDWETLPYLLVRQFKSKEIQKVYKCFYSEFFGNIIAETNGTIVTFLPNKFGKVLSTNGCMVYDKNSDGYEVFYFSDITMKKVSSRAKFLDKEEYYKMVA